MEVDGSSVLIDVPIAIGAAQPAAEFRWSTISTPSDGHVADLRVAIEGAYERVRTKCGELPPITEAKQKCWHKGCGK